jgi:hypothetical protein
MEVPDKERSRTLKCTKETPPGLTVKTATDTVVIMNQFADLHLSNIGGFEVEPP